MPAGRGIPTHVLLACQPFSERLGAEAVAAALAAGLREGGRPEPDGCPLPGEEGLAAAARAAVLEGVSFEPRMRAARAVVIAARALEEASLAGSMAFEIATRARQGGIPCYAVAAASRLDSFDARVLDLQLVLEAGSPRALRAAGRRLAEVV
jgi:glycerate kinase